ncbi:DUF58 domain-containing protein [Halosolutus gelatinilyticus]|uniref:DUF58 domain-containing protein n=1 Tax=Halosolutus gelatinilyticus TaxID=2931975 RepID=UPI001FF1AB69|nr:DUF58 domain-containing protein [Halosolutus gelatinilyticus]
MRPTRRLWAAGLLALACAGLAVVFARPLLLAATAAIGAWILARQYLFVATLRTEVESLTVAQSSAASAVRTGEETPVTIAAERSAPSSLSLALAAGVPTVCRATDAEPPSLSLEPGESTARTTATVEWPVAGRHAFAPARLTATDGLFESAIDVGSTPTVTVEPRGPRAVHVGSGGDRVAIAQGSHEVGRTGSGLEPAELREYVAGDTTERIDWKATARLGTPHVREYESETDRPTALIVDHRAPLATGPPDETKLDYLREAALSIATSARRLDDPLGLVTVGDGGLTNRIERSTRYRTIRRRLLDLEPDGDRSRSRDGAEGGGTRKRRSTDPTVAVGRSVATNPRSALERLGDGDDPFARTLAAFYRTREPAHERVGTEPLLAGVRAATARQRGRAWTIICTDDSDPATVRDAVGLARAGGTEVLVLLAPTVLYEPGDLADIERAYDRYAAFERFRRDLDRTDRVRALEVAPGDRLSAVLAAGADRTRGEIR